MKRALVIPLLLLAIACGNDQRTVSTGGTAPASPAAAAQTLTPEQLGELGAQIQRQPDRANELLSNHGLTPEKFEQEIRKVTEDAQASKRYAEAYRRNAA